MIDVRSDRRAPHWLIMTRQAFVTGGTGYLGGRLNRALTEDGWQVRALSRKGAPGVPDRIEIAEGDLSDPARLAAQMRGCDTVFHCAALVAAWVPDERDYYRTNVDGLRNVMQACRDAGVSTLVYTSSFFALGPSGGSGADETAPLSGKKLHPYQHSKLLARIEADKALDAGFPVVILYPGVIYGPGAVTQGNLVARLISDFLHHRIPGLLGDGRQLWSYAFIDDVVKGHLLALRRSPSGGEYVLGGDNVSLKDFFVLLAHCTGMKPPILRIPLRAGMALGGLQMWKDRLLGRAPALTPSSMRMMYLNWACDSRKARRELGYSPRPLCEGLRATLLSMRSQAGITPSATADECR